MIFRNKSKNLSITSQAYLSKGEEGEKIVVSCTWDTGSQVSFATKNIIKALGLEPIFNGGFRTTTDSKDTKIYLATLSFGDGTELRNVILAESDNLLGSDMLIGMEVLLRGYFALTPDGDEVVCEFYTP